ncbi:MAG: mercury resistance system transport protein MerF [Paracoccaceae bacterium]
MLKTGIIGTIVVALCCFTPVLVVLLGAIGLSGLVGYLDVVLIPVLIIFVAITVAALMRRARS